MEFRYPKSIKVGSHKFNIKYSKAGSGAEFQFPCDGKDGQIVFGMADVTEGNDIFLEYLIHEFKEMLQLIHGDELMNPISQQYQFSYTHTDHDIMCCHLAGLLSQFIK